MKRQHYHLLSCQRFPYENGSLDALDKLHILKTELYVMTAQMSVGERVFPPTNYEGNQNGVRKQGLLRAKLMIPKINTQISEIYSSGNSGQVDALDNYVIRVSDHRRGSA